jgi:hypothetical protein
LRAVGSEASAVQRLWRSGHASRQDFGMTTYLLPPMTFASAGEWPEKSATEDVMRSLIVAIGLAALAAGSFAQPAAAKKSKMGCEIGKEIWDAGQGKCVAGKYTKKSAKKAKKDE